LGKSNPNKNLLRFKPIILSKKYYLKNF